MAIIDLPNNQTALFRDGSELTNKDVKTLRRAARVVGLVGNKLKELGLEDLRSNEEIVDTDEASRQALSILSQLTDDEDDNLDLFQRVCVAIRIKEWTLDRPIPTTPEEVDELERPLYEALTKDAADLDLNEGFEKTPETLSDPKAPSES